MLYRSAPALLAIAGMLVTSAPSFAVTGAGCPDLPAYARAQGTLTLGEGACNMTKAEAMRILAQERPDLYGAGAQAPTSRRR